MDEETPDVNHLLTKPALTEEILRAASVLGIKIQLEGVRENWRAIVCQIAKERAEIAGLRW